MDIIHKYPLIKKGGMLDAVLLNDIHIEVISSYSDDEIISYSSFDDFFTVICIDNGYEPDWDDKENFYKPYYETIFYNIRNKLIKE